MTPPGDLIRIWVYLSETPLLWLTATLFAFAVGDAVAQRFDRNPVVNPVVIAAGILILVLISTGTPYQTYFAGAQFVHFLLGPATVALGLPLWRNRLAVRRNFLPMVAALLAGSLTAIASAVAIAWALAIVGTLLILKIVDVVIGLRVKGDEEIQGLDLTQHGEEGYNI